MDLTQTPYTDQVNSCFGSIVVVLFLDQVFISSSCDRVVHVTPKMLKYVVTTPSLKLDEYDLINRKPRVTAAIVRKRIFSAKSHKMQV
jgi:hypothetical protein